jgi:alpha,alpha-trehalose phosphorylase
MGTRESVPQRASYSKDRRIVLCHATEKSRLILTCATDNAIETSCPHAYKVVHTGDFGQRAEGLVCEITLQTLAG